MKEWGTSNDEPVDRWARLEFVVLFGGFLLGFCVFVAWLVS
jgi:hypothetical protein